MLNIIVAIDENNAIGNENKLPWHLSEDLKFFKRTTTAMAVVMGRKTWQSLPIKPLPNRINIVMTRNPDYNLNGVVTMNSVSEVVDFASSGNQTFVIGGAEVYKTFLPLADKLYVTKVYKSYPADAYFPAIDPEIWLLEEESELHYDEKEDVNFKFLVYKRRK
ncbi:MAG: dihydrofolate reductase [Bacteroidetes bacterium]|nr:dihydrofolate reductase [Bacteroidota bacterium]